MPERLRAAREALGLTQRQLAKRLEVDPSTLWKWKNVAYSILPQDQKRNEL